jgi:hypothetical protein
MAEPIPSIPAPHCPHCDAELPGVGLFNWQYGIWLILGVYCPDCRKALHFQIAPVGIAADDSRIQIPS